VVKIPVVVVKDDGAQEVARGWNELQSWDRRFAAFREFDAVRAVITRFLKGEAD
jgi:hypothetical protein